MGLLHRLLGLPQSRLKYPVDLIEPLKKAWPEWRRHESDRPPLPAHSSLSILLEIVYHASFTIEEKRGSKFSIVICKPQDTTHPMVFLKPREFSIQELRRLAPIAAEGGTMIGVFLEGDRAEIWGTCSGAWMQLSIATNAAGAVEVGRNGDVFASLRAGQIVPESIDTGTFGVVSEFVAGANSVLWKDLSYEGGWSPQAVVYPGYLLEIASKIQRRGHGGTILGVPDTISKGVLQPPLLGIKYACDDNQIWSTLQVSMRRFSDEPDKYKIETAERELQSLLDRAACLAEVDGAVVLTDRLRILGFGAEVLANKEVGEVQRTGGQAVQIESFGTRHRSAFRFCAAYPGGIALICSQDGGLKCAKSNEGKVVLYE